MCGRSPKVFLWPATRNNSICTDLQSPRYSNCLDSWPGQTVYTVRLMTPPWIVCHSGSRSNSLTSKESMQTIQSRIQMYVSNSLPAELSSKGNHMCCLIRRAAGGQGAMQYLSCMPARLPADKTGITGIGRRHH